MDEYVVQRTAETAEQDKADHLQSQRPNKLQISLTAVIQPENPVIHDFAHNSRLDQIHQHLADHERAAKRQSADIALIYFHILISPHLSQR